MSRTIYLLNEASYPVMLPVMLPKHMKSRTEKNRMLEYAFTGNKLFTPN